MLSPLVLAGPACPVISLSLSLFLQAELQCEGGEEMLAPRQVASDHWSTPAPAGQQELDEWKRARIEQTAGMMGQRQVAFYGRSCIPARLLMCLLAHLRIYSPTHVSAYHLLHYLQAEAEKISADVARTAVLSRQRHEEQKVRKATRHPAVASCVPGCNHMEPGCEHVSYLPRCSRPHTSKRSRRPRRPRRPVSCLLGGQFLLLGGQKLTPPI